MSESPIEVPNGRLASRAGAVDVVGVDMVYRSRAGAIRALGDTTLHVDSGEFIAIIGPSGCGKSTALRLIASLLQPSSGRVEVDGRVHDKPPATVSMVFQEANLLPWKTVFDNVYLPLKVRGLSRRDVADRVESMIAKVGLSGFAGSYPHELSGGMQQRVGVARALITDPQVLLLDEPFGALDALTREVLNLELMRIWVERQPTVALVTHSIDEAVFLANRVCVMSERPGRIVEELTIDFPYPRTPDVMESLEFVHYAQQLRSQLYATMT